MDPATVSLESKKLLVIGHVEKEAVMRGKDWFPIKNMSIIDYVASILPSPEDVFEEPGAIRDALCPERRYILLPLRARVSRRLIIMVKDLFDNGLILVNISDGSFIIESESELPRITWEVFQHGIQEVDPEAAVQQLEKSVSAIADIIEYCVCSSLPSVPEEVRDGLLPLMKDKRYQELYMIINHPSLVPLPNRYEFNSRMHSEMAQVLPKLDKSEFNSILAEIQFPVDWRCLVDANSYLRKFMGNRSTAYDINEKDPIKIAFQVLRFIRNFGTHGMADDRQYVAPSDRIQIAQMMQSSFPLTMHSVMVSLHRRNKLQELSLESLFS